MSLLLSNLELELLADSEDASIVGRQFWVEPTRYGRVWMTKKDLYGKMSAESEQLNYKKVYSSFNKCGRMSYHGNFT
ncbi:unnamed protein product [Arabis nemorensis]|uniref:Uncharacterized protein n=1 Tax=Arabis nemorensis TaxID=586526 RepID=A0A565CD03_9BRAS|nr:unnamed protein product [Arabis nemorensis]